MGDFNLHHPMWDLYQRRDDQAERLIQWALRWELELVTPYGEVTRVFQGHRDSTIDHCWASRAARVTYEGPADLSGSDHIPQVIRAGGGTKPGRKCLAPNSLGRAWKKLDKRRAIAEAAIRFRKEEWPMQETEEA